MANWPSDSRSGAIDFIRWDACPAKRHPVCQTGGEVEVTVAFFQ
jgi:hypothetical protein